MTIYIQIYIDRCKYFCDSKKIDNLSFKSKYSLLSEFFNDLNKLNNLKTQKEKRKKKKQMWMMQLQIYIMNCYKHVLMSTIIYQIQKEKE